MTTSIEGNGLRSADLGHRDMARMVIDTFLRQIIHHGLWFAETRHQLGEEKALELLDTVAKKSFTLQLHHLGELLGFHLEGDLPSVLLDLDAQKLKQLQTRMAKNWLVSDGLWFQAVEAATGMNDAKRINDSCWAQFSPVEAMMIKSQLGMGKHPGLDGLARALGFRMYASINEQQVIRESASAVVLEMTNCRVQAARKRRNLADYPCKSAGLVEYSYFARAIDDRISTECIGCPPDPHPPEWYCAWRFTIADESGGGE